MHTLFSGGRRDYYYHIYIYIYIYIYTQLLEIRLNGHNFVSFEATISIFFVVIDLNETYNDYDVVDDDDDHDHDDAYDDHVD